jgi:hypothetical protein
MKIKTPNDQPAARKRRGKTAGPIKPENLFQFDIHGLEAQFGGSSLLFKAVPARHEFVDLADGSKSHGMHFSRDAWCYFDMNADKELTSLTCSGLRLTLTQGVISLSPALVTSSSEK